MTDKQIIIDGVNVAECEDYGYRDKAGYWCHYYDEPCTDYSNCYYKQLQRKEQECEELKQYNASKQASYEAMQCEKNKVELENRKLKQALKEIKEECEHYKNAPLHFEAIYAKSSIDEIINILNEVKDAD